MWRLIQWGAAQPEEGMRSWLLQQGDEAGHDRLGAVRLQVRTVPGADECGQHADRAHLRWVGGTC